MKNAMKKIMSLLLVVFMLATILPFAALAEEFDSLDEIAPVTADDSGVVKSAPVEGKGAEEAYGFIEEPTGYVPMLEYKIVSGSKTLVSTQYAQLDGPTSIQEILAKHEDVLANYKFNNVVIKNKTNPTLNTSGWAVGTYTSQAVEVNNEQVVTINMGAKPVQILFTVTNAAGCKKTVNETETIWVAVGTTLADVYKQTALTRFKTIIEWDADDITNASAKSTVTSTTTSITVYVDADGSYVSSGSSSNNNGNGVIIDGSNNGGYISGGNNNTGDNNGNNGNSGNNGNGNGSNVIIGTNNGNSNSIVGSNNGSGNSSVNKLANDVELHIYLNNNLNSPAKKINITEGIALDGKVTMDEVAKIVRSYYKAKDSNKDMPIDGLYVKYGNWASSWANDSDKYDTLDNLNNARKEYPVYIMVMATNATAKTTTTTTSNSDNPKTGDTIFMTTTVMGLSATALACVYFLNKKKLAK